MYADACIMLVPWCSRPRHDRRGRRAHSMCASGVAVRWATTQDPAGGGRPHAPTPNVRGSNPGATGEVDRADPEARDLPCSARIVRGRGGDRRLDIRGRSDTDRRSTAAARATTGCSCTYNASRTLTMSGWKSATRSAVCRVSPPPHPRKRRRLKPRSSYGPHLAGQQEIVLNFFTISIQHIHSLLKVVAEAVGYDIDPDDDAFFRKFRPLRNHFEHWSERLPGKTGEVGLITKTVTAYGYRSR